MALIHGRRGSVELGGKTFAKVVGWSYEETADTVETTGMEDTSKSFVTGLRQGSGTIDLRFSDESDAGLQTGMTSLSAGTEMNFSGTPTTATVSTKWTGSVLIVGVSYSQTFDDVVNISLSYNGVLELAT